MTDFTEITEDEIGDWIFRGNNVSSPPDTLYLALHTSDPGGNPDGSTEVSESDYSRVEVQFGNWSKVSSGSPLEFEYDTSVTFDSTNGWGTITHASLWDDSDISGRCLIAGELDSPISVGSGETARFRTGELSFTID